MMDVSGHGLLHCRHVQRAPAPSHRPGAGHHLPRGDDMSSLIDASQAPNIPRLSSGTTGAISELVAAADLMRHGYHVFRALSPNCPSDLVIYRTVRYTTRIGTSATSRSGPAPVAVGHLRRARPRCRRRWGVFGRTWTGCADGACYGDIGILRPAISQQSGHHEAPVPGGGKMRETLGGR